MTIHRGRKPNGEGTVYKRYNGKWCGQISFTNPETGKSKRKTVYGKTKIEATEKLNLLRNELNPSSYE